MATPAELQALLRFLSQDAKVPLAMAMGKIKDLQREGLTSTEALSKVQQPDLASVFPDPKICKQIISAAKRMNKKRTASDADASPSTPSSASKRKKPASEFEPMTPAAIEESLALPASSADEEELTKIILQTNRAPLVLVFAVALLKHTMPQQPISSRLSLAQAVVSANSKSKARSIGLESGKSAEEEGWGQGHPTVKIMGREVSILKRWGYEWKTLDEAASNGNDTARTDAEQASAADSAAQQAEAEPALWGVDLEAFRTSNKSAGAERPSRNLAEPPIYTAQSARSYLLKSFDSVSAPPQPGSNTTPKKQSSAKVAEERERNLGMLLHALDLLYASWSDTLGAAELDRRAWSWYVSVRPEIKQGVAGWGEKGEVKLRDILDLRRKV